MSAASYMQYCYLAHFSKPRAERLIYQKIRQLGVTRIVELGLGQCQLAPRMIAMAQMFGDAGAVHYTGIDLFESRSASSSGITLRDAYRVLRTSAAKIRLVPGDPFPALARYANSLANSDLLVIHADQDQESMRQAWFYVPRMLHERSLVMVEDASKGRAETNYRVLTADELRTLTTRRGALRRAA